MTTHTLTIYGASDDLIEIEGAIREEFHAITFGPNGDAGGYLAVSDGTVLRIVYDNDGIWRIAPITRGAKTTYEHTPAPDNEDDGYSDKATLTSDFGFAWVALAGNIGRPS